MNLVVCDAPTGELEIAPVTSFAVHKDWGESQLDAFWTSDGSYLLRARNSDGMAESAVWYQFDIASLDSAAGDAERLRLGALLCDVLPLGGGRVAFPVGSTGRRVYRVWRSGAGRPFGGKTRVLGVRAARSRRLPA